MGLGLMVATRAATNLTRVVGGPEVNLAVNLASLVIGVLVAAWLAGYLRPEGETQEGFVGPRLDPEVAEQRLRQLNWMNSRLSASRPLQR
jgi:hypothetical protein